MRGIYISKRLEVLEIDEDAAKGMPRILMRGYNLRLDIQNKIVR